MEEKIYSYLIPMLSLLGLMAGIILHYSKFENYDHLVWMATLVVGSLPLAYRMLKEILKGHFGIDLIAIVAIISSFLLQQYLAGTVILLMLSGGEALEAYAVKRAGRELTQLLSRAPSIAHIKLGNQLKDIQASEVKTNDVLTVKPGEIIPVDAIVTSGFSDIDESTITGESLPVAKSEGALVYSGSINKDRPLEIRALKPANESQYERIVKLVKEAQEKKAPVVRLADRYAGWFTAITLLMSGGAWLVSHDPVRFLAVLVVATPCPLILATPIAMISGISKAASRGIIIKSGGALEQIGEAKTFVFDKTGTLTLGTPQVVDVKSFSLSSADEVLRVAASLDQLSAHVFGRAIVDFAKNKKAALDYPENFREFLGNGVSGTVNNKKYFFGRLSFLKDNGLDVPESELKQHDASKSESKIPVYLADEKNILGCIFFADVIRPEMKKVFSAISEHQIKHVIMLTGDKEQVAKQIAEKLGIKEVRAQLLPEQKVEAVKNIPENQKPVVMVGDGVNDAPALAAANVGIALGMHGTSAASEAGDVVITVNNMVRVHDALHIGQRVMALAKQSIFVGMGVSMILMIIAAFGYIPPVYGALLQEGLDVAVILNALRLNFEKIT